MSIKATIFGVSTFLALELNFLYQTKANAAVITNIKFNENGTNLISFVEGNENLTRTFMPGETMVYGGNASVDFTINNSGENDMGNVKLDAFVDLTLDSVVQDFVAIPQVTIPSGSNLTVTFRTPSPLGSQETWTESQIGKHIIAFEIKNPRLLPEDLPEDINRSNFAVQGLQTQQLSITETFEREVQVVPEPLTILGSVTALGIGYLLKKKYSKQLKSKEKIS